MVSDTPIFEKKNVVVTGGAGLIGSHLCEALLREAKVICVDDFSGSSEQNINHLLQHPDFEFIKHDVTTLLDLEGRFELDKFKVKFQGVQEIYHLACPTSPKQFDVNRPTNLRANSLAMLNTLELAVKYRAKYVFTSSAVVYGDDIDRRTALTESDQGVVNQLGERACYDEGKRFAESCVATYRQQYGLDAKIARVFTTYGPRMKLFEHHLIPDFIINALEGKSLVIFGDASFSTSLCYVTDLVDGLTRLMAADPEVWVVNLGGEEAVRYTEVARLILELTGSSAAVAFAPPLLFLTRKGTPSIRYAREMLGWFPLVGLPDGLRKTVDYVISHKEALLLNQ